MSKKDAKDRAEVERLTDIKTVAELTARKEMFWLKGKREERDVYRIHTKYLYFNIENGRYADKMLQLSADNPQAEIDPRDKKWRAEILKMLKGDYPGTEADRDPFETLQADIQAREQLRPGVVLQDGGVLDGNRRLAVLLDLQAYDSNPERYAYFDAVVLPGNVSASDRWRIEAGLQLGRDEQHDYSPINRLLKIREGLELFKKENPYPNKKPEQVVAETLFGVTPGVIKENIERIKLIDAYLAFIKRPKAYHEIGDRMERFIEAVNILDAANAKQWQPQQIASLRAALFAHIRDTTMTNYELRQVIQAIGRRGKPTNEKAIGEFLKTGADVEQVRDALASKNPQSPIAKKSKQRAKDFLDLMEASEAVDEPVRLANRAKKNLDTLLTSLTLERLSKHDGWKDEIEDVPDILDQVTSVAKKCAEKVKAVMDTAEDDKKKPKGSKKSK